MVTYNRKELLEKILLKIASYNWDYLNIIIINNNSDDGTDELLNNFILIKNLLVIKTDDNIGHGAGLAYGIEHLKINNILGDFIVFLEDDSIPHQSLLNILLETISSSSFDLISSQGVLVRLGKRINVIPKKEEIQLVEFCLLDGAIMKRKIIDLAGLPKKDWFMMFDDFEYCYRIRKAGFRIGVIQNTFHEILHEGAGTSFSNSSIWRSYYQARNHIFFLKYHFSIFNLFDFIILETKRCFSAFMTENGFRRLSFRIKGHFHGIIGRKGKTINPKMFKI